jgi:pimeloyl-ACP methyl ester carboxylesterase
MKTVSTIQPNSERAFFKIFHFPKLGCQQSIEKIIHDNKFKFPIEFYYGDHDWMESGTARSLVNRRPNDNKLLFRTVENSGHQILFDNPHRMASFILQENMI